MSLATKAMDKPAVGAPLAIDIARLASLLVLALLLQTAVAPNVGILGAHPDFVLLAVVAVALLRGAETGAVFGFIAGGLVSIVMFEPAGIGAFILVILGYVIGRYAETTDHTPGFTPVAAVFVSSIFGLTLYALAQFLLGRQAPIGFVAVKVLAPSVLLDTLLAAPVYLVARWWMRGERLKRVSETR
jgi:rod shape-determining protein MreD